MNLSCGRERNSAYPLFIPWRCLCTTEYRWRFWACYIP